MAELEELRKAKLAVEERVNSFLSNASREEKASPALSERIDEG